jgi:TRAP transporter TAXI family solute receptor
MDQARVPVTAAVVRRRTVLSGAGAALAGSLVGALASCGSSPDYPAGPLRIASGRRGGVYYEYADGVAAVVHAVLPRLSPVVLPTAASLENLWILNAGYAELAFTSADAAADGYRGMGRFTAPIPMAALARIYESYLHLVVRRDRGIRRVLDLRGKAVSIGEQDSGTELFATRVLKLAGLDPARDLRAVRLPPEQAAESVQAGQLDAMFFLGGIPTSAVAGLVTSGTPVALLDLGGHVSALRAQYGEVYLERTIPASTYRQPAPTVTAGVANYLVVPGAMDARVAYRLVRALFEHRDMLAAAHPAGSRLDRGAAISTDPLPLHPGAERYYREAKL